MGLKFIAPLAAGLFVLQAIPAYADPESNPTLPPNNCAGFFKCLTKTNSQTQAVGQILTKTDSVTFKNGEDKNLYYVRIKLSCDSAGLKEFAKEYTDAAWNLGLLSQNREHALSVDVEKISGGAKAATKISTYLIGQIKRTNTGDTTVEACDDYIATDLPFNNTFRLKFKILESKTNTVNDGFYASFRFVARFIGFAVGGGPTGAPITAALTAASTKISDGKSDIDILAAMFNEVNTENPQFVLDNDVKSVDFKLRNGTKLTIERVASRSTFLRFDGDKIKNPGDNFDALIADDPGLDLKTYLTTSAAEWDTLLMGTDAANAAKGCKKIRDALRSAFTSEESTVLLAEKLSGFGSATLAQLKEPCLSSLERTWLKNAGMEDPLPPKGSDVTKGDTPAPAPDQPDDLKWAGIKDFLGQLGRVLIGYGTTPEAGRKPAKLAAYLDDRVATQSFDLQSLLPSSDGVLKDTLAAKIVTWPFGQGARFGCFIRSDKKLTNKFSAQMLVQLDASGPNAQLVNLIIGFADPNVTEDNLLIGNIILEKSTAGSLAAYQKAYQKGCGDKSDPWKPWENTGT